MQFYGTMDADENTRMMIQLASMMMQNQNAMREAQSQLEAAKRDQATVPEVPKHAHLSNSAATLNFDGLVPFGMDPKLMAEFARQIVMNANQLTTQEPAAGPKRSHAEKPATIAQIIQSQQKSQTVTAKNTSEGKIFVYNQLPDENLPQSNGDVKPDINILAAASAATNGGFHQSPGMRKSNSIGPIRNRYGRVLRPGIDNFGRFEAVANPGLIIHAMELLRQKDKKKRGPKEKETFSVFMYCLPDKNSKLPKFSSLDPIERALVDQHQQEGFGYPSQDYINGIPRKTQLCLSFDDTKFHSYMALLYPKLTNRLYDMYRIDKTRRLIRVEAKSPRQLKDMKYQGSLIVIPYDSEEDRPAAVIHRNFDDVYNNNNNSPSLGNPLSLMQNFTIPLPSLPELVVESTGAVKVKQDAKSELPVFPRQQLPLTTEVKEKFENGNESCSEDMETSVDFDEGAFEHVRLLQIASDMKSRLQETQHIHVRPESLYTDLMNAYRKNPTLEHNKIVFCFQAQNCCPEKDEKKEAGTVFVLFWEEAFRKNFTGNQHKVPVLDPCASSDVFKVYGRILVHGLVLENYFPVRFSPASLVMVLTESCSEQLALTSFYQVMSESEKDILEAGISDLRSVAENYSAKTERCVKIVLGSYGCKTLPDLFELDAAMIDIAKTFQLYQPHWALCQIREGMVMAGFEFDDVIEEDILQLYQILTPTVPTLLQRIQYENSSVQTDATKSPAINEVKVRTFFEQYLVKLSKSNLLKLLQEWSGYDCLSVPKLTVKFTDDETAPIFAPKERTLILPCVCTSVEELAQTFEKHFPSLNTDSRDGWEYTL